MEHYDVVVVGAGPGGSAAARAAAMGGARTLLVDQRRELDTRSSAASSSRSAEELVDLFDCRDVVQDAYQLPETALLREIRTMVCVSPSGRRFVFPLHGYTVSRRAFDKALALGAEGQGAELRFPCGVTRVHGDTLDLAGGSSVQASVIIGADGPLSTVARGAGFSVEREMFRMITATSYGDLASEEIELHFGRVAPGGYAWVFPREGDANVGLGVVDLPKGTTLGGLLDRFTDRLHLTRGEERTRWWVPIGPPPESAVRGQALLVGDAANLVMATNGGGIPTAMISGYDAGVVAARHVRAGAPLADYDRSWKKHLYGPLARAERIKRFGDHVIRSDLLLSVGMRYIGAGGLDAMMRLRWPARLGRGS